jgi:hypothetical protein
MLLIVMTFSITVHAQIENLAPPSWIQGDWIIDEENIMMTFTKDNIIHLYGPNSNFFDFQESYSWALKSFSQNITSSYYEYSFVWDERRLTTVWNGKKITATNPPPGIYYKFYKPQGINMRVEYKSYDDYTNKAVVCRRFVGVSNVSMCFNSTDREAFFNYQDNVVTLIRRVNNLLKAVNASPVVVTGAVRTKTADGKPTTPGIHDIGKGVDLRWDEPLYNSIIEKLNSGYNENIRIECIKCIELEGQEKHIHLDIADKFNTKKGLFHTRRH